MLASRIPPERTGVDTGIFNMFSVIPMRIQSVTLALVYRPLPGGDARDVVPLAGALLLCAGGGHAVRQAAGAGARQRAPSRQPPRSRRGHGSPVASTTMGRP